MPRALSREPGLMEAARRFYRSGKTGMLTSIIGPLAFGAALGSIVKSEWELRHETPQATEAKAAQLWRENGYDVGALKSYEERDNGARAVTFLVTQRGNGQKFEATAVCGRSCSIRKIAGPL